MTLLYLSSSFGGVIGCIYGGLMTEYVSPTWCWFGYAFYGLIIVGFACALNKKAEEDGGEEALDSDISTSQEDFESGQRMLLEINGMPREEARELEIPRRDTCGYRFRKNCQAIGRAITMREIY